MITDQRAPNLVLDEADGDARAVGASAHLMQRSLGRLSLYGILLVLFGYVFVINAWLSDDAYITFRAIDNFVHGYGLRWNIDERVQVFTHPLWLLVLSGVVFATGEVFVTTYLVSFLFCAATLVVSARWVCRSDPLKVILLAVLVISSKSFVDYSSSGLEFPLCYLMAALFIGMFFREDSSPAPITTLTLLAALAWLSRPDTVVLYFPALVLVYWVAWAKGRGGLFWSLILGISPVFLWVAFALFYYGFPFPNSAYAKLGTGVPVRELVEQGVLYFRNSAQWDPLTFVALELAILVALLWGNSRHRMIAAGLVLYAGYVLRVGGCFMAGRFFALPFLLAVLVLLSVLESRRVLFAGIVLVATAIGTHELSPIKSGKEYRHNLDLGDFVHDERSSYFESTGLLLHWRTHWGGQHELPHEWYVDGRSARERGQKVVRVSNPGFFGYSAGPQVHVVDQHALTDPLLARLPADWWVAGHFYRELPAGYLESLQSGENRIADPDLKIYYDKLRDITTGPLLSWPRFKDVLRINLGGFDDHLERYLRSTGLDLRHPHKRSIGKAYWK